MQTSAKWGNIVLSTIGIQDTEFLKYLEFTIAIKSCVKSTKARRLLRYPGYVILYNVSNNLMFNEVEG